LSERNFLKSQRKCFAQKLDIENQPGDSEEFKEGRLFSNPFGILGHESCSANIDGEPLTGVCYNEVECVVRGGIISGYCGAPAIKVSILSNNLRQFYLIVFVEILL
jgi:hypothetical protein